VGSTWWRVVLAVVGEKGVGVESAGMAVFMVLGRVTAITSSSTSDERDFRS